MKKIGLFLSLMLSSLTVFAEANIAGISQDLNHQLSAALKTQRETSFSKFVAKNRKLFVQPYSEDRKRLNLTQEWKTKQDVEALEKQNQIIGEFTTKDASGLVFSCKEVITFIDMERKSKFSDEFLVSENLATGAQGSLHKYSCSSPLGDFQSTVVNDNYLKYVFRRIK